MRLAVALALAASVTGTSSCLFPSDRDHLGDRDYPPLESLGTDPAAGAEGVPRNPTIRFSWTGRVHPDAIGAGTLYLTTGTSVVRCARRLDLVGCATELRPQDALRSSLLHRAVAKNLWSMEGGQQHEDVEVVFVTGDATEQEAPADASSLAQVTSEIFAPRCASCHSGYAPPTGLDLSTETSAREGLVGVQSLYRPGVRRVVPGRHASSYLLWKLLDLPGIWGDPMPPPGTSGWPADRSCGTRDPDLGRIAGWVDGL